MKSLFIKCKNSQTVNKTAIVVSPLAGSQYPKRNQRRNSYKKWWRNRFNNCLRTSASQECSTGPSRTQPPYYRKERKSRNAESVQNRGFSINHSCCNSN